MINEEEVWPFLILESDEFNHLNAWLNTFSLSFISQGFNSRLDLFAKRVRTQLFIFSYKHYNTPMASSSD